MVCCLVLVFELMVWLCCIVTCLVFVCYCHCGQLCFAVELLIWIVLLFWIWLLNNVLLLSEYRVLLLLCLVVTCGVSFCFACFICGLLIGCGLLCFVVF